MSDKPKPPKSEMVGSTADADVQRLIRQYGKDAFLEAVKRQSKAKRGRKPEMDWLLLMPYIQVDALDWLEGCDPIRLRSHYSVAQQFAKERPGYNQTATVTRVMKKLSGKRRWMSLVTAWQRSDVGFPYKVYLRVLELMAEIEELFAPLPGHALYNVAQYRTKFGKPDDGNFIF